jgi:hypothetical protein
MPTDVAGERSRPLAVERAKQVFRFLKDFVERSEPTRRQLSEHPWQQPFRELPSHPDISIGEVVLGEAETEAPEDSATASPLLRVKRPRLTKAPPPSAVLADFVLPGWEDPDRPIEVQPSRNVQRDGQTVIESLQDDPQRVAALSAWKAAREKWKEAEQPARAAMRAFERLFALRARLEREGEGLELVLGDGRLRWRTPEGNIDHPVLLQRVDLTFDPTVPEFRLVDADRAPELYGTVLQAGVGLSPAQLNRLRMELETGGFHPLNRDATSAFLRGLAQRVGPRGRFHASYVESPPSPDPVVMRDPVLFLRTRISGFPAAFDRILESLEKATSVPVALTRLVGVETAPLEDEAAVAMSPWGEPSDVLLSKPANAEQIQIARTLERHKAVIVQGPPGTGKSHTIANLIGHLVAQGKRVLVTSHTTKALRVLREQVVEKLRPLCVAVLDHDLDSRTQMEQSVRGILARVTQLTKESLDLEIQGLSASRHAINKEIDAITARLREAREVEYLPITLAGQAIPPSDAAREVLSTEVGNNWIPGPLESGGGPLPISAEHVRALYESNHALSPEEEREIDAELPELATLPRPEAFKAWVDEGEAKETAEQQAFWGGPATEGATNVLEALAKVVNETARELAGFAPWQRVLVAAGHEGPSERGLWEGLARQVHDAHDKWQKARPLLVAHEVAVTLTSPADVLRDQVNEILSHLGRGGTLGWLQYFRHSDWKAFVQGTRVDRRTPSTAQDFRALLAFFELRISRQRLAPRWQRQAESVGFPRLNSLGDTPELALRDLAGQFASLCGWWPKRWSAVQEAASAAGLRWQAFRDWHVARSPKASFDLDAELLATKLPALVAARAAVARALHANRLLAELGARLTPFRGACCEGMRVAVRAGDVPAYEAAFGELERVAGKVTLWRERHGLLARLGQGAPRWADQVRARNGVHGARVPPGEPAAAWRWRQLKQEVDRRAGLDEVALTERLHSRRDELRRATAELIDRCAWRAQLQRTDLKARQALQGWADTVKKIGKGTGKRVPELQAQARVLLAQARDAVPVWIMPLARVAESFDPTQAPFDVVIIDEASQSDVSGLLAWYLAERVAVVGDHEQVSPMAVGQQIEAMRALIAQHLDGIPNHHLYDGL